MEDKQYPTRAYAVLNCRFTSYIAHELLLSRRLNGLLASTVWSAMSY